MSLMNLPFRLNQKYTTRNGQEVELLAINPYHPIYPLVFTFTRHPEDEGDLMLIETDTNGCFLGDPDDHHDFDVLPRFKEVTVLFFKSGEAIYAQDEDDLRDLLDRTNDRPIHIGKMKVPQHAI